MKGTKRTLKTIEEGNKEKDANIERDIIREKERQKKGE